MVPEGVSPARVVAGPEGRIHAHPPVPIPLRDDGPASPRGEEAALPHVAAHRLGLGPRCRHLDERHA